MKSARYAFAAHPEALEDLRSVPGTIRDLALLELQHLVHGNERGAAMHRELAGCHKVYVDPQTRWRLVFQFRDAPPSSQHRREIFLVAVGERRDNAVYRTAADRLRREAAADVPDQRAKAARSRSPHARPTGTPSAPGVAAPTAAPAPATQRRSRPHPLLELLCTAPRRPASVPVSSVRRSAPTRPPISSAATPSSAPTGS